MYWYMNERMHNCMSECMYMYVFMYANMRCVLITVGPVFESIIIVNTRFISNVYSIFI